MQLDFFFYGILFIENACSYLNHGLTKVPWTLRDRGYGAPLSEATDIPLCKFYFIGSYNNS